MKLEEIGEEVSKKEIEEREKEISKRILNILGERNRDETKTRFTFKRLKEINFIPDFSVFHRSKIVTLNKRIIYNKNDLSIPQIKQKANPTEQLYSQAREERESQKREENKISKENYRAYLFEMQKLSKKYLEKNRELFNLIKLQLEELNYETKEEIRNTLKQLGYSISPIEHRNTLIGSMAEKIEDRITESQALWGGIKQKKEILRKSLESLLLPLLSRENSFLIYNPSTDYNKETFNAEFAYRNYERIFETKKEEGIKKILSEMNSLSFLNSIAISSKLSKDSQYLQIDFQTTDLEEVRTTLKMLGEKGGYIINSGNSFHYHNPSSINSQKEWYAKMEDIKSFDSIGKYWPEFQQKQGFSMLRITPSLEKPFFPEIITKQPTFENKKIRFEKD